MDIIYLSFSIIYVIIHTVLFCTHITEVLPVIVPQNLRLKYELRYERVSVKHLLVGRVCTKLHENFHSQ